MSIFDFAVIGAGMAGASIAAELAAHARVLLLEAESAPGYHTTGRSAAFWEECYGGPDIVPLTLASGPFLRENGFLAQRGALYIGRESDARLLDEFMARFADTGASLERLGKSALDGFVPGLRDEWAGAILERACADIDVAALHQYFLNLARSRGVESVMEGRVRELSRGRGGWQIATESGAEFAANAVVNAAGAWADGIAQMAGARTLGITPLRRTVVQVRTSPAPPADLPLVLDIAGRFYFKPDAGRLWLSPHDEAPSVPCDAAPEELAVAEAIERLESVVDWSVDAVERRWAGLRSFAPDRLPVYGRDPDVEGFVWFSGQGGFGIQTAPAAARLAAHEILGLERDEMTSGLNAALYAPSRFRR